MKLIIGSDKFPLINIEKDKYVHVFPVTKYQFERYLYTSKTMPVINYCDTLTANPRISPNELTKKNARCLFMTALSFSEASDYARWMGGRLPLRSEMETFYPQLRDVKVKELCNSVVGLKDVDHRCVMVLQKLDSLFPDSGLAHITEMSNLLEMCSEMSFGPFKPIYTKTRYGWNHVVGTDACASKIDNSVFRSIINYN